MCVRLRAGAEQLEGPTARQMAAIRAKWDRLTPSDVSQIRSKGELIRRVQERYGLSLEQAKDGVEIWTVQRSF
jgi:hypothetical protein